MCQPGWTPGPDDAPEEDMRRARNCDGMLSFARDALFFPFAPELDRCPWAVIDPDSWDLQQIWHDWKTLGLLPYPGDIGDQPVWVVEALQLCEAAIMAAQQQVKQTEASSFADALAATKSPGVDGKG